MNGLLPDDDDEEGEDDDDELLQLRAMAQLQGKAIGGIYSRVDLIEHMRQQAYDDEDDYGDEEDDDNEDDDEEVDEEAAARMMMMMDEQEKLFMQQQLLEREYLAAAHAANTAQQMQLMTHLNADEGVGAGNTGMAAAMEECENDLILAGTVPVSGTDAANNEYAKGEPEEGKPVEIKNWLQWYLALEDHDFIVEIDREFLVDKFNLINLRESLPNMTKHRLKEALRLILSSKIPSEEDL